MRNKITICLLMLVSSVACGIPTKTLCMNKLYRAAVLKVATSDGVPIPLTAIPMNMPEGTVWDANSFEGMYVIEFMPDANTLPEITFEVLVTFDPNMCVEPPTRIVKFGPYSVVDSIPAPEVPVIEFEVVE